VHADYHYSTGPGDTLPIFFVATTTAINVGITNSDNDSHNAVGDKVCSANQMSFEVNQHYQSMVNSKVWPSLILLKLFSLVGAQQPRSRLQHHPTVAG